MPENPTVKEVMQTLEKLITLAENKHSLFIGSLWITEAKVLLNILKSNEWILGE